MTRASLKQTTPPRHRKDASLAQPDATRIVLTAEEWREVHETLVAVARARDGDQAARKTEIRRRMRALARATRDDAN